AALGAAILGAAAFGDAVFGADTFAGEAFCDAFDDEAFCDGAFAAGFFEALEASVAGPAGPGCASAGRDTNGPMPSRSAARASATRDERGNGVGACGVKGGRIARGFASVSC